MNITLTYKRAKKPPPVLSARRRALGITLYVLVCLTIAAVVMVV